MVFLMDAVPSAGGIILSPEPVTGFQMHESCGLVLTEGEEGMSFFHPYGHLE